jgi:hypothetical protein
MHRQVGLRGSSLDEVLMSTAAARTASKFHHRIPSPKAAQHVQHPRVALPPTPSGTSAEKVHPEKLAHLFAGSADASPLGKWYDDKSERG